MIAGGRSRIGCRVSRWVLWGWGFLSPAGSRIVLRGALGSFAFVPLALGDDSRYPRQARHFADRAVELPQAAVRPAPARHWAEAAPQDLRNSCSRAAWLRALAAGRMRAGHRAGQGQAAPQAWAAHRVRAAEEPLWAAWSPARRVAPCRWAAFPAWIGLAAWRGWRWSWCFGRRAEQPRSAFPEFACRWWLRPAGQPEALARRRPRRRRSGRRHRRFAQRPKRPRLAT